jgi:taspase (threonine aspartase 1)
MSVWETFYYTRIFATFKDSPQTNAGLGSNLTINGTVECDASVMDGSSLQFGAVGCASGVVYTRLLIRN